MGWSLIGCLVLGGGRVRVSKGACGMCVSTAECMSVHVWHQLCVRVTQEAHHVSDQSGSPTQPVATHEHLQTPAAHACTHSWPALHSTSCPHLTAVMHRQSLITPSRTCILNTPHATLFTSLATRPTTTLHCHSDSNPNTFSVGGCMGLLAECVGVVHLIVPTISLCVLGAGVPTCCCNLNPVEVCGDLSSRHGGALHTHQQHLGAVQPRGGVGKHNPLDKIHLCLLHSLLGHPASLVSFSLSLPRTLSSAATLTLCWQITK